MSLYKEHSINIVEVYSEYEKGIDKSNSEEEVKSLNKLFISKYGEKMMDTLFEYALFGNCVLDDIEFKKVEK